MRKTFLASIAVGLLVAALLPAAVSASGSQATVTFASDTSWEAWGTAPAFTAYNTDGSTSGLNDLGPAYAVSPTDSLYTATIPGASWIWAPQFCSYVSATQNQFATFTKTIDLSAPVISANVSVAADNDAEVFVNGRLAATVGAFSTDASVANQETSFQTPTAPVTVTVPGTDFTIGANVISVVAMNFANGSTSCATTGNPAALLVGGTITVDTAPTVTSVTLNPATGPVAAPTSALVTATFTDPDPNDPHTASVNCGNGTTVAGTVSPDTTPTSAGTVTAACDYASAGVYTVTVTVTDSYGLSGSGSTAAPLVVYDPSAGFVTGGGWITDASGNRANFGFVAKYQSGGTTPVGSLEYQYSGGNFHSTGFTYLVVSGDQATLAGTGTLNGVSGYSFVLTVVSSSPDEFQITISGPNSYSSSSSGPLAINQGSIQIHT